MTDNIRRQLTLFVEQKDAEAIEKIRKEFNPTQSELIKSHVTLCREDEIVKFEEVIANINRLTLKEIVIEFAEIKRFDNGKGVMLPAKNNTMEFDCLRRQVLSGIIGNPRRQEPHITLMHPGNSTCTDKIFRQIEKITLPAKLEFKKISFIEQRGRRQWEILQEFNLSEKK